MIAVSPEGGLRVVNGNDVGYAGDLIIAFHNASFMASPGSADYSGLGSRATAFVIADYGPQPVFSAIANDDLDDILAQTFPSAGIASVIGLANSGIQIGHRRENEEEVSHDETRVPLSVIEGCLHLGVATSEMAGFDTKDILGELSPFQLNLVGRMFPLAEMIDLSDSENTLNENAQVGDEVGIRVSKEFDDGHGDVTYTLSDDAGGLFAIDPETGVVTVAGNLDYETASSYTIEVTATSEDSHTQTKQFTINITNSSPEEGDTDNAVSAISAINGAYGEVSESIADGSLTGLTVGAADVDGDYISYSLVDDAGGAFEIDSATGEVSVADSSVLDYETAQSQTIIVQATSTDGSTSTQTFTIALTDNNAEFSVSSITDGDGSANIVLESATVGSQVGVQLSAADGDLSDVISYSLSDDAGGRFTVDPSTGVVTVAAALDYETSTSHSITVVATSTDGSTTSQSFTVNVSDDTTEFSASAITDSNLSANTVSESATIGTAVGVTFLSQDNDGTDSITYTLTNDAGGLFAINASTGEVTVNGTLDYESVTSHLITVLATSTDGSTSTHTLTVGLTDDTSEFAVTAVVDTDAGVNTISENASIGSQVGITLNASDSDATDTVTYTLTDNAGGMFAINATTGVVTVNGNLDYETATQHTIVVQASSTDGSTSNQSFVIDVSNADPAMGDTDNSLGAITDSDTDIDQVAATASVGATVGVNLSAIDADGDNVVFSLTDDAGGLFEIDSATGVVTVAADVSTLTGTTQTITVVATSSDGSLSSKNYDIDIIDGGIGDLSDNNAMQNLVGDASNGYTYLQAKATDGDGDNVTYSLTNNHGGAFSINSSSGQVYVANHALLNASTDPQVTIEVKATSADGSHVSKEYTIDVTSETDGSNIGAITDSNGSSNIISESAANGTTVGLTAYADPEGIGSWIDSTQVRWHAHGWGNVTGIHANGIPSGATVNFYLGGTLLSTVVATGGIVYAHNSGHVQSLSDGTDVWATVTYDGQTSNVASGQHYANFFQITPYPLRRRKTRHHIL